MSDAAKSLISRILNLDPSKRPTLDEILQHPFMNNGGSIPKLLPVSTLACAPSASYLKYSLFISFLFTFSSRQFMPAGGISNAAKTMFESAPFGLAKTGKLIPSHKPNMMSTDRGFFNKPQSPSGQTQTQVPTQAQTQVDTNSNMPFERPSTKAESNPGSISHWLII